MPGGIAAPQDDKKGPIEMMKAFWESETKQPHYMIALMFFMMGSLASAFIPFYTAGMNILIGFIIGVIALWFPFVSLLLTGLSMSAAAGYQSPEFGLVFFIYMMIVLLVALIWDWKFGYLTFLMIALAKIGIPMVVPLLAMMLYSLLLGVAITIASTIFFTLLVTNGNMFFTGFFVGPPHATSYMIFCRPTPGDPPIENCPLPPSEWTPGLWGESITSFAQADVDIIGTVFAKNMGLSMAPILQIVAWCFAVWVITFILKKRDQVTMKDWIIWSTISMLAIVGATLGALACPSTVNAECTTHLTDERAPIIMLLLIGLAGTIYTSTALGLMMRDMFSQYFSDKGAQASVGTRISDMVDLAKTKFEDVGGLDDVKQEIKESLIIPLLRPDIADYFGITPPRGILLFGAPGCGKTMLMKALASELDVEMVAVKCSDVMSKWYGESENKIAEVFRFAKERRPCILFLDEIDAIAKNRSLYAADDVTPRILSIMLSELDGIEKAAGMIVVGTTNKPEMVDPAMMRPGRLDKIIYIPPPDFEERIGVFKVHLKGKPVDPSVNLQKLAKKTERYSGADIANLVKEGATISMKRAMKTRRPTRITMKDFEQVLPHIKPSITLRMKEEYEKMKMDYERKMHELQRQEKKVTVRWDDVGGMEEIKRALREFVELPLKNPELMEEFRLKSGRGILLFGPPGCGKTHVMRAAANELGIPIQIVNGPELVSALAGVSEAGIRDVFSRARENAPSVIFFDEIDALASKASMRTPEVSRAVSQFLTELDGVKPRDRTIIVATTNRPGILDPALLRPGRFDKMFYVPPPDLTARKDIFEIHARDTPKQGYIDTKLLAHRTEGYSGADIAAIVDEGKLIAVREKVEADRKHAESTGIGGGASEADKLRQFLQQAGPEGGAPVGSGAAYGVKMEHLLEALTRIKPSITPETIEWCKSFMEAYGQRG
ncbi:MAG TPA: AAA family ATPase [Thermoplasmata archaeon]|nr:AAA family ATPase [Thermoplasmata archaeon]